MESTFDKTGTITLTWNLQTDKLYSPDGTKHCLPCEICGKPEWVGLSTVSVMCQPCADSTNELVQEFAERSMHVCALTGARVFGTEEFCPGCKRWKEAR